MVRPLSDHLGELQNAAATAYSAAMVVACETEAHLIFADDPDFVSKTTELVNGGGHPYGFVIGWHSQEEGDDDVLIATGIFDVHRNNQAIEDYMERMTAHFKSLIWPVPVFPGCVQLGSNARRKSDLPPIEASTSSGWIVCPFCGMRFLISDAQRWDGQQHTTCGQKLIIKDDRIAI